MDYTLSSISSLWRFGVTLKIINRDICDWWFISMNIFLTFDLYEYNRSMKYNKTYIYEEKSSFYSINLNLWCMLLLVYPRNLEFLKQCNLFNSWYVKSVRILYKKCTIRTYLSEQPLLKLRCFLATIIYVNNNCEETFYIAVFKWE